MVMMQSWMFLRSFVELRAMPEEKIGEAYKKELFTGLLRETSIEALAHLGPNAFEEISGEVVQSALMTFENRKPSSVHRMTAFRLVGLKSVGEKVKMLQQAQQIPIHQIGYNPLQADLLSIPETPFVYWLRPRFFELLKSSNRLASIADVRTGLQTSDNERFIRYFWETPKYGDTHKNIPTSGRWFWHVKGGRYQKWAGLLWLVIDWEYQGSRISTFPMSVLRSPEFYFRQGLTYTLMARGSFAARIMDNAIFGDTGSSIFLKDNFSPFSIMALTSVRVVSYLLRVTTQGLKFREGYVSNLTLPTSFPLELLTSVGEACTVLKRYLVALDVTEQSYAEKTSDTRLFPTQAVLHSFEGMNEQIVSRAYGLNKADIETVLEETGTPAGWYPLIAGYDTFPTLPGDLDLPPLRQGLLDYLTTHDRISPEGKELARIKANLRMLYEAGPGAKNIEQEENYEPTENKEGEEEIASGAHIPVPTETFLEGLSVNMQLHPVSVYWLLEELQAEGVRCKPEELQRLEDRLSVLILRLLGHRWPKQLEAGEPVPTWASSDGIIPLVSGTGEATLAEQVRARLRVEDGELGVQQAEALLTELTGQSLEEWLRRKFFSRHMSQFKYRPIAWHLASTPTNNRNKKRGWTQRGPTFECLLYYHACSGDAPARIRTQYIEPLLRAERQKVEDAYLFKDEAASVLANARIQELEAFVEKLRFIEEQGFACAELDKFIAVEPIDRWSGDGYLAPASRDELLRNEQAWHVDINDGVRVNIAPLQLAGVLASDVLRAADAKKALADRACWRADERRWVRDGKLPRCGWMDERVPESQRWTEREPERIAEQIKLEQKRQALQGRQAEEVEI